MADPSKALSPRQQPRTNPFTPGLGYDPAKPQQKAETKIPSRLELPPEAYRDANKQYSLSSVLPKRPDGGNTSGKPIKVRLNQFQVQKWPEKPVYQYDVQIGNGSEKRGLNSLVWNSEIIQSILSKVDSKWIFDGSRIAWSCGKPPSNELRVLVDLDKLRNREPRLKNGEPEADTCRCVIRCVGTINMSVIKMYLEGKSAFNNTVLEAINFLDHLIRQWPSQQLTLIKRSFYARIGERYPIDNYIEALKGVYTSIRLCQPLNGNTGLALNVDVANGTFFTPQALHTTARNMCPQRNRELDWYRFRDNLRPVKLPNGKFGKSDDFRDLAKLEKIRFHVRHRGKDYESKPYISTGLVFGQEYGEQGAHARNVKFTTKDGKEITVDEYFRQAYGIKLEFWFLPLINTTKAGMFPMEVCTVPSMEPWRFKLGPEQTAKMIKFAVTRPKERVQAIKDGYQMLNMPQDPYLAHYGFKVDTNMTMSEARLLPNPEVQFNGAKINPLTTGRWDLRGKKFLLANPQPLVSWGVCIVDNGCDRPTLQNFLKVLIQTYQGHGGIVKNREPYIHVAQGGDLAKAAAETRQGAGNQAKCEPQILFFIIKERNSFTYDRLKKNMDCRWGIVSQMLFVGHVFKCQPQYCSNVCMKLNAKLGGTTCRIAGKDPKTPVSFFPNNKTMIIGSDVSHPAPGSPQPSMAAMTMSMDLELCRYAAAAQTNGVRLEMITKENMSSCMMPLFDHWIKAVGKGVGPSQILYFRDGVSEGQYLQVLEQEVADMKALIREKYGPVKITFTVIVCSKRHHIRIFPKEGDAQAGDRNGNPYPGTLVEKDCTHPFEYDFYLNSHAALQGTARPVHYHVLLDEAQIPTNKLHQMIYQHCYQYMRSTTPVSLYPAVYYAHLASNRARAHEDAASSEGPRGGQKFMEKMMAENVKRAAAGLPVQKPETVASADVKPLLELGVGASEETRKLIRTGMWYI